MAARLRSARPEVKAAAPNRSRMASTLRSLARARRSSPAKKSDSNASSGEDVPRGMDFLFSRNRLNVAVSRARALAVVVCSPRLLWARCNTVEQMRLVNALCSFAEEAERQAAAAPA